MPILVLPLCGLIREICQVQCINSRVLKQQSFFSLLGSVRIVEFRPEVDFLVSFLSLKMIVLVDWSLCVEGELLPQVKKFKYLGVTFTSGVTIEWEIDRRISAASAVMQTLYRPIVVKRELSWRAKLSNYRSIFRSSLHMVTSCSDWTNEIADASGWNGIPLSGGLTQP